MQAIPVVFEGVEYPSLKAASVATGIPYVSLHRKVRGTKKTTKTAPPPPKNGVWVARTELFDPRLPQDEHRFMPRVELADENDPDSEVLYINDTDRDIDQLVSNMYKLGLYPVYPPETPEQVAQWWSTPRAQRRVRVPLRFVPNPFIQ